MAHASAAPRLPRQLLTILLSTLCVTAPITPQLAQAATPVQLAPEDIELVKKGRGSSKKQDSETNLVFLRGDLAWLVAGGVGALVPLVLFALPFVWSPGLGPAYLPFLVLGLVWGTLMVTGGGVLAWFILALFSDMRSGFLIPTAAAALIGLVGIVASGALALLVFWPFYIVGAFYSGNYFYSPTYAYRWWGNPFGGIGTAVAFAVWGLGIVATSIAGPMVAAWLYKRLSVPRQGSEFRFTLTSGDDVQSDINAIRSGDGDGDGRSNRSRRGSSKGRSNPSRSRPRGQEVGAECSASSHCRGTCNKSAEFGGGMCTKSCPSSRACPEDTACVDREGGMCAPRCETDSDCKSFDQGFVCRSMEQRGGGDVKVCRSP